MPEEEKKEDQDKVETKAQDKVETKGDSGKTALEALQAQLAEARAKLAEAESKLQSSEQYKVGLDKLSKSHAGLRKQLLTRTAQGLAEQAGLVDPAVLGLLQLDDAWGEDGALDEAKIAAKIEEHKKAHPRLYAEPELVDYLPPLVGSGTRAPDPLGPYAGMVARGQLSPEAGKAFRAAQRPNGATSVSVYAEMMRQKKQ